MAKKISKTITTVLLAVILNNPFVSACGWFEYDETYRISMFRAEIDGMWSYRPFYYTPEIMYADFSPERNGDWLANCKEWNALLGNKLILNDVYSILYQVSPEMFMLAYEDKNLKESFDGNTFIENLLLPKNKEWLDYMVFAKKNEYNNQYIDDPWNFSYGHIGHIQSELIDIAKQRLNQVKDPKLAERYAYQLIRLYRQAGLNNECILVYNNYFGNLKTSTLKYWSMLHYAEALDFVGKKVEASYLFSLVFNNSAEKRVRAFKLFDNKLFDKCLALARNKEEIAGLWALTALKNPGPAMEQFKHLVENNPVDQSIPVLIIREVNKLEDWIFTPKFTNYGPSLYPGVDRWMEAEEYDKIMEINKIKDLKYLNEFINYLDLVKSKLKPELADYLNLVLGHLNLMANNDSLAITYLNKIKTNVNPSIQIQKNIELALYYGFEKKITDEKVKEELAKSLVGLEKIAKKNNDYMKQLHSICEFLSRSYRKSGDIVSASLLKLKAESYKMAYEEKRIGWSGYNYLEQDYYWGIAYLDRFASTSDIDKFIDLKNKKNKTDFEEFITNQSLATNYKLLDLKGTLALRSGNLNLALEAFKSLPHDCWDSIYEFAKYLKYNPFVAPNTRDFNKPFKFNKAEVVAEVVRLMDEAEKIPTKAAENYLKIGNFFYNCTYWGNSWMMLSYSKTVEPLSDWGGFSYHDILFDDLLTNATNFELSFYKSNLAKKYYQKAENLAKNKEVKAMITYMNYCCDYNSYTWLQMHKSYNEKWDTYKPQYLRDLFVNYRNTEAFKDIYCSTMYDYAEQIGVY